MDVLLLGADSDSLFDKRRQTLRQDSWIHLRGFPGDRRCCRTCYHPVNHIYLVVQCASLLSSSSFHLPHRLPQRLHLQVGARLPRSSLSLEPLLGGCYVTVHWTRTGEARAVKTHEPQTFLQFMKIEPGPPLELSHWSRRRWATFARVGAGTGTGTETCLRSV